MTRSINCSSFCSCVVSLKFALQFVPWNNSIKALSHTHIGRRICLRSAVLSSLSISFYACFGNDFIFFVPFNLFSLRSYRRILFEILELFFKVCSRLETTYKPGTRSPSAIFHSIFNNSALKLWKVLSLRISINFVWIIKEFCTHSLQKLVIYKIC